MLVHKSIPNLISGVSQQPDSLRLPTQAEEQINMHSSVVEGLKDRPPTEYINTLIPSAVTDDVFVHFIDRDLTKKFVLIVGNGWLRVFDLTGAEKTVTFPNGTAYISVPNPRTTLRAITVSDYTFIVNTSVQAERTSNTSPTRQKEALIFVKSGHYGSNYKVYIDGTVRASYTTSTTNVSDIATDNIATQLVNQLSSLAGYAVARRGSVIHLTKSSGDFTITVEDSQGGASLQAFKDTTQSFSALPVVAPRDFQITITADPDQDYSKYHIKFVPANTNESFGEGVWEETVGMGVQWELNPSTMPHALRYNANDTFTFAEIDWDKATAGDDEILGPPSFVGKRINDIFFVKNRLGLLCEDSVVLSSIGSYFNMWPSTAITVVDNDPIDVTIQHTRPPNLQYAIPFDERVLLFTDTTQFILGGEPVLTQKTVRVDYATEFMSDRTCRPIAVGRNIYFTFSRGGAPTLVPSGAGYQGIREYFANRLTNVLDAVDITAQIPRYIPIGAYRLFSSTSEYMIGVLTVGAKDTIFVYKYFFAGDEKLQSAWAKFVFEGAEIVGATFIESLMVLVVKRPGGGIHLELINFAPGVTDPGLPYTVLLDRRVTEAQLSPSYNAVTNRTTFTLPYVATTGATIMAVTRDGASNPGAVLNVVQNSPTTFYVVGDYSTTPLYAGEAYQRSYTFSKFYVREESQQTASSQIVSAGRLQLRRLTVVYSKSGPFAATVVSDNRPNVVHVLTGVGTRVADASTLVIGQPMLQSGEFHIPLLSENLKTMVTLWSNGPFPMRFVSAEWEGLYHRRTRRV